MNTHQHGYYDNKDNVLKRLKRAEGQVRGIARMVEEDTYCIDILTQVSAAQAALNRVAVELIRDHAKHCMAQADTEMARQAKADELALAINRVISR